MGRAWVCSWLLYALIATTLPVAEASDCSTRKVVHKPNPKEVAEIERAVAEGHQPWRNDVQNVARATPAQDDPALDIHKVDEMECSTIRKSETKAILLFSAHGLRDSYRITLKRLRWKNPATGENQWTAWWPTETLITHCPQNAPKGNP
jgi:hypothetical protein